MSDRIDAAVAKDRRHWLAVAREADGDEGIDWLAAEMKDYYRDVLPGREPDELASAWSWRQYDRGCDDADAAVESYDWHTAASEIVEAVIDEARALVREFEKKWRGGAATMTIAEAINRDRAHWFSVLDEEPEAEMSWLAKEMFDFYDDELLPKEPDIERGILASEVWLNNVWCFSEAICSYDWHTAASEMMDDYAARRSAERVGRII